MCSPGLERELTVQQHTFPEYGQMRAHAVTVINARARGLALLMVENLNFDVRDNDARGDEFTDGDHGVLCRMNVKSGREARPTRSVSVVGALAMSWMTAGTRLTSTKGKKHRNVDH